MPYKPPRRYQPHNLFFLSCLANHPSAGMTPGARSAQRPALGDLRASRQGLGGCPRMNPKTCGQAPAKTRFQGLWLFFIRVGLGHPNVTMFGNPGMRCVQSARLTHTSIELCPRQFLSHPQRGDPAASHAIHASTFAWRSA